jgi:hypothetical protein
MKTVIKVPILIELESGQPDRKVVTKVVRDFIQPEMIDFISQRFSLDWLSSSQKREIRGLLGDNPSFRIVSQSQVLKTGIFPNFRQEKYDLG